VREAVFNILGNDLTGLTVLDLFAGTGCMGIEALSRGASDAFFIDNSRKSLGLIKKNLIKCGFEKSGVLLNHDILTGLDANKRLGKISIDLVFIDPPYGMDLIPPESLKSDILPDDIENLHAIDFRIYGETKITFYNLR
jgi:16S rRNA (guanine(966)-N(2))-methyltransferase RsmD